MVILPTGEQSIEESGWRVFHKETRQSGKALGRRGCLYRMREQVNIIRLIAGDQEGREREVDQTENTQLLTQIRVKTGS